MSLCLHPHLRRCWQAACAQQDRASSELWQSPATLVARARPEDLVWASMQTILAQKCQHLPLGSPRVEVSRERVSDNLQAVAVYRARHGVFLPLQQPERHHMVARQRHHLQCIASDNCDDAVRSLDPVFLFFLAVASLACGSAAPVVPNIHTLSSDFSTSYAAALVHNSVNTTATVAANPLHATLPELFPQRPVMLHALRVHPKSPNKNII